MTGLQTLTARLLLGVGAAAAGIALSSAGRIHELSRRQFGRLVNSAFLLTRLGVFSVVFLIFGIAPRGDVPAFYFPEATSALSGSLPYRDFTSSYAPLHSYVDGAVLLVWHSQLALILFAIAVEFLLLALWLRVGRDLFSERDLRIASVLYVTSAVSLQFVAIDGQDNVLAALLILVSLWMAMRSRTVLSGILAALAAVMVKLIPIFYAPVFFAGIKRRWAWALGFVGVVALGYGSFAVMHLPVLQPVAVEGPLKSAGTLPFLIEFLTGFGSTVPFWRAILLLALAAIYGSVWRVGALASDLSRVRTMLWAIAASTMVLLIFANKSWPAYLLLILFPLCVAAAGSGVRARVAFCLFGIVALVEHSYWATLLGEASAQELHRALFKHDPQILCLVLIELLLLSGYAWLLWECVARALGRRIDIEHSGTALDTSNQPLDPANQPFPSLTPGKDLR